METGRPYHQALLQLLDCYHESHPDEASVTSKIRALVQGEPRCLERDCFVPGHITASCWILSPDDEQVLLTHHRKLGRWLQLGGHADGEADVSQVALREAQEESGMERFECLGGFGSGPATQILDLDVHAIPARRREPEHEHHDIRFLFRAAPAQPLVRSEESNDLRWFHRDQLEGLDLDASTLRMWRKCDAFLGREPGR